MVDTPSDRLKLARMRAGYRDGKQAAVAHGWKYDTYKNHESGARGLKRSQAEVYAKAFRVSVSWLLTGEVAGAALDPVLTRVPIRVVPLMELISIEQLKAVARGGPPVGVSDVPVDAGEDITPRTLAIRVEDTSMRCSGRESLEPGDTVLFAPEASLEPGCIVLAIVGDEAVIRKYRPALRGARATEFSLVPLNEDFPTIRTSIADGSEIVGRAIRHIRPM
jgi:SOS-response transcriptional repressor LexA